MHYSLRNILLVVGGLLVAICLGLLLVAGCGLGGYLLGTRLANSNPRNKYQPKVGLVAPDFTLLTLSGDSFQLSELQNQVIVLNFWASWCGPCVEEMATLQAYYEEYGPNLVVVGVNADEPRQDVVDFVDKHDLSFPILLDSDSLIQDMYHIKAYPTSYFIDRERVVRAIHIGLLSDSLLDGYLEQIGVGDD